MVDDEEDTSWLNIDLSGIQPTFVSNIGHNQKSELDQIAEDARRGLGLVADGEETAIQGWRMYGAALNEGREMFPSDEQFGQWCDSAGLSQVGTHEVKRDDRVAAMWAAANPEQFEQIREKHPNVRTVRGWHTKWKKESKPTISVVPTDTSLRLPDDKEAKRIKSLKDRAASTTSESERKAVESKLDKYREEGIDVDAVLDQKQEDEGREDYFREKATRDDIAFRIAGKLVEQGNIRVIKALVLHAFPTIEELEQAETDYTT